MIPDWELYTRWLNLLVTGIFFAKTILSLALKPSIVDIKWNGGGVFY